MVSLDLHREEEKQGPSGLGPPGLDGADGLEGLTGPPGQPGIDGIPGVNGAVGPPGMDGADGADGLDGTPGASGRDGRDGVDGVGIPGPPGLDGEDGLDAFPIPGPIGVPGTSVIGPSGFDGVDGEDGLTVPGLPGAPGASIVGPQGIPGIGIDGADGEDAFPIPGPPGAVGPPGPYGHDGAGGAQGPPGLAIDGIDGLDGMPIPGPRGADGSPGISISGPPGMDGQDGLDNFDWMMPGPPGVAGTNGAAGIGRIGPPGMDGLEGDEQWHYMLLGQGGGVGIPDAIWDADMDTGIQVDEGDLDDNTIRFDTAGVQRATLAAAGFDLETHMALGSAANLSVSRILTITELMTSAASKYGIYEDISYAGDSVGTTLWGFNEYVRYQGVAPGSCSTLGALSFIAYHESAQAIAASYGVQGNCTSNAAGVGAWTTSTCFIANGSYAGSSPATAYAYRVLAGIGGAAVGVIYGLYIPDLVAGTSYLAELGPAVPYLRVLGNAAPGANLTNIWMNENGNLRRVQWVASDATGHVLPAGTRVMVLV